MKCCFCNKEINGFGNNPAPVKFEGRCCDECNLSIVILERLKIIRGEKSKQSI